MPTRNPQASACVIGSRALGPIVTYKSGPKAGEPVVPDVETWFQQDQYQGNPHLVAQWADLHNAVAQAWVTADPSHSEYVDSWAKSHASVVAEWTWPTGRPGGRLPG
jgi:potassium-transporting ATPase KdpC subunit